MKNNIDITASFEEIEISVDGRIELMNIVIEAKYHAYTEHYGADADGNRGLDMDLAELVDFVSIVGEQDGTLINLEWEQINEREAKKITEVMDSRAMEAFVHSRF